MRQVQLLLQRLAWHARARPKFNPGTFYWVQVDQRKRPQQNRPDDDVAQRERRQKKLAGATCLVDTRRRNAGPCPLCVV